MTKGGQCPPFFVVKQLFDMIFAPMSCQWCEAFKLPDSSRYTHCDYFVGYSNSKESAKSTVKIYFWNSVKFIWPFKNLVVCKKL